MVTDIENGWWILIAHGVYTEKVFLNTREMADSRARTCPLRGLTYRQGCSIPVQIPLRVLVASIPNGHAGIYVESGKGRCTSG